MGNDFYIGCGVVTKKKVTFFTEDEVKSMGWSIMYGGDNDQHRRGIVVDIDIYSISIDFGDEFGVKEFEKSEMKIDIEYERNKTIDNILNGF